MTMFAYLYIFELCTLSALHECFLHLREIHDLHLSVTSWLLTHQHCVCLTETVFIQFCSTNYNFKDKLSTLVVN